MGTDDNRTPRNILVSLFLRVILVVSTYYGLDALLSIREKFIFAHWADRCSKFNFFYVYHSEGGYFKAHLIFPKEYPQRPPKMTFVSEFWHPNGKYARTYCVNLFSNTF